MSLFNQDKWNENNRRVSIPLQSRASNYLTLYSIAKDSTKSKLIRRLIEDFISTEKKLGTNESKLIELVANRLSMQWKIEKANGKISFQDFKNLAKEELEKKGVDHTHISLILIQIVK